MECKFYIHDPKTHDLCINYVDGDPGGVGCCKLPTNYLCIRDLNHILPSISHSSRNTFVHCRQAYYFHYIKGIYVKKNRGSIPLKLGSIWGLFIQSRHNNGKIPATKKMGTDRQFANHKFKDVFWDIVNEYQLDGFAAAKLYAICKAFITLKINVDLKDFDSVEKEFYIIDPQAIIHGFIDIAYSGYFKECKLSGSPDRYHSIMNIENQVSTYFLSNPDYEYCIIEAVKVPGLKAKKETLKTDGESPEAFGKRVCAHVISKPSEFFPGFNRDTLKFGKKFYRSEFPLDQIHEDYKKMNKDILTAVRDDSFYQSKLCYPYGDGYPCDYLPICQNKVISEELFEVKKKPILKEEDNELFTDS